MYGICTYMHHKNQLNILGPGKPVDVVKIHRVPFKKKNEIDYFSFALQRIDPRGNSREDYSTASRPSSCVRPTAHVLAKHSKETKSCAPLCCFFSTAKHNVAYCTAPAPWSCIHANNSTSQYHPRSSLWYRQTFPPYSCALNFRSPSFCRSASASGLTCMSNIYEQRVHKRATKKTCIKSWPCADIHKAVRT